MSSYFSLSWPINKKRKYSKGFITLSQVLSLQGSHALFIRTMQRIRGYNKGLLHPFDAKCITMDYYKAYIKKGIFRDVLLVPFCNIYVILNYLFCFRYTGGVEDLNLRLF